MTEHTDRLGATAGDSGNAVGSPGPQTPGSPWAPVSSVEVADVELADVELADVELEQRDPAAVERLADLLRKARRPVFIVGQGSHVARAEGALVILAGLSGALLATPAATRGLFAGDPWSIDVSEGHSSRFTDELVRTADVVVGWGAALSTWPRNGELISPEARVVQIGTNAEAAGEHTLLDLSVVADVGETAQAVLAALYAWPRTTLTWRTPQLRRDIARQRR